MAKVYAPLLAIAAKQILDGKCEEASVVFAAAATMYVQLGPRKVMEGMTKAFRERIKGESDRADGKKPTKLVKFFRSRFTIPWAFGRVVE